MLKTATADLLIAIIYFKLCAPAHPVLMPALACMVLMLIFGLIYLLYVPEFAADWSRLHGQCERNWC